MEEAQIRDSITSLASKYSEIELLESEIREMMQKMTLTKE